MCETFQPGYENSMPQWKTQSNGPIKRAFGSSGPEFRTDPAHGAAGCGLTGEKHCAGRSRSCAKPVIPGFSTRTRTTFDPETASTLGTKKAKTGFPERTHFPTSAI